MHIICIAAVSGHQFNWRERRWAFCLDNLVDVDTLDDDDDDVRLSEDLRYDSVWVGMGVNSTTSSSSSSTILILNTTNHTPHLNDKTLAGWARFNVTLDTV